MSAGHKLAQKKKTHYVPNNHDVVCVASVGKDCSSFLDHEEKKSWNVAVARIQLNPGRPSI